jgi:hypothetical protein
MTSDYASSPEWQALLQENARLRSALESLGVQIVEDESVPVNGEFPLEKLLDFEPPAGNLETRLEGLFDWLERFIPCHQLFVCEQGGLPLVKRRADEQLVAECSRLMDVMAKFRVNLNREGEGVFSVEVAPDRILYAMYASVGRIGLTLVMVVTEPLASQQPEECRELLRRILQSVS